jgi:hypothetical protein
MKKESVLKELLELQKHLNCDNRFAGDLGTMLSKNLRLVDVGKNPNYDIFLTEQGPKSAQGLSRVLVWFLRDFIEKELDKPEIL